MLLNIYIYMGNKICIYCKQQLEKEGNYESYCPVTRYINTDFYTKTINKHEYDYKLKIKFKDYINCKQTENYKLNI